MQSPGVTTPPSWLRHATTPGSAMQPHTGEAFIKILCHHSGSAASPLPGEAWVCIGSLVQRGMSALADRGIVSYIQPLRRNCIAPPPLRKEGEALFYGVFADSLTQGKLCFMALLLTFPQGGTIP